MSNENYPKVSIIVVTHNNQEVIGKCLESVLRNNYPNYELIVVDNGSTDNTLEVIREIVSKYGAWSKVRIIRNKRNYGIAKALNIGIKYSKGKYLAFLDSDAFVDPNWLFHPIKLMEEDHGIGAIQVKILKATSLNERSDIIDSAGGFMDIKGTIFVYGKNRKLKEVSFMPRLIFYCTGTGCIIRKSIINEVGMFDPLFRTDLHDVDICWRIWLRGYKVLLSPHSVIYHLRGATRKKILKDTMLKEYLRTKYYLIMIFKNSNTALLIKLLMLMILGILISYLKSKNIVALMKLRAIMTSILFHFKYLAMKRRCIQRLRVFNEYKLLVLGTIYRLLN